MVQLHSTPISFPGEGGEWEPINDRLVAVGGGYANVANSFRVFFPNRLTPVDPITIDYPQGKISFSLEGGAPSSIEASPYSVTYPDVRPGVDIAFDMTSGGIKERAILDSPGSGRRLHYRIDAQGLTLEQNADGEVAILAGEDSIAYMPAPFAYDSRGDLESGTAQTDDVDVLLRPQGRNAYQLSLDVDREWLEASDRVFPVTVDPWFVQTRCEGYWPAPCPKDTGIPWLKDTWMSGNEYQSQHESPHLYMGLARQCCLGGTLPTPDSSYMTFDVRQEVRKIGDLVYDADFSVYSLASTHPTSNTSVFQLMRITHDWDERGTAHYNSPLVDSKVWATHNGCSASGSCGAGWLEWDVKALMQYWIDTHVPSNHGWQLAQKANVNQGNTLASGEHTHPQLGPAYRPFVNVWVNAMPGTKVFAMDDPDWPKLGLGTPSNGQSLSTSSPTLTIQDLTDKNLDPIVVRYQVSSSRDAFDSAIVYDSGWIDEVHSHRVPTGALQTGDYYWRVKASDVCPSAYKDPDEPQLPDGRWLCNDLSGDTQRVNAGDVERPTSEIRLMSIANSKPLTPELRSPPEGSLVGPRPTFRAIYRDPDESDRGRVHFEIYKDLSCCSGTPFVTDRGTEVSPGSESTWTPAVSLPAGKYQVRTYGHDGIAVSGYTIPTRFEVDDSAPTFPTITQHPQSPANDVTPTWAFRGWEPGGKFICRLQKGSTVTWGPQGCTSPETVPADAGDGQYTFYVAHEDDAGNRSAFAASNYVLDTSGPPPPTITKAPATPTKQPGGMWWFTGVGSVSFECRTYVDGGTPPAFAPCTSPQSYPHDVDGLHHFQVRGIDSMGNRSDATAGAFVLDRGVPAPASIASSTHPDPNAVYRAQDVELNWWGPVSLSGVVGWARRLDDKAGTTVSCGETSLTQSATLQDLDWGIHYLHVAAVNKVGTCGETAHFRIQLHPLSGATVEAVPDNHAPDPMAHPPLADVLEVVPPPPGGLSDIFPEGGLLGDDPFFGGDVLPDANPAAAVADAFAVAAPPNPPLPNAGELLAESGPHVLGTFPEIPAGPVNFLSLNATTYTLETTNYDGDRVTTTSPPLLVCTVHRYNSRTGATAPVGTEVLPPVGDFDLEVNFCPAVTSIVPGSPQQLTYELRALSEGVRVEAVARYEGFGKRLRLETDARTGDHPGTFDMVMSAQNLATESLNRVEVDTDESLDEVRVRVDQMVPTGYVPEAKIRVENLPERATVEGRHVLVVNAVPATADQRTQSVTVALQNQAPNPNESIVLESFDTGDGGKLLGRIRFEDVPRNFETHMAVALESSGAFENASPRRLTVQGDQPAAPDEVLTVEQWDGEEIRGRLKIDALPSLYGYSASLSKDAEGREKGLRFEGLFPEGRPAEGEFRLTRHHPNSATGASEVDAALLVDRFAPSVTYDLEILRNEAGRERGLRFAGSMPDAAAGRGHLKLVRYKLNDDRADDERIAALELLRLAPGTSFTARLNGDPSSPSGLHLERANSVEVPGQIIEILRTPVSGPAARLVVVGSSADESEVAPHVRGLNLRWDAPPPDFTLDVDVEEQGNGTPSTLRLTNVSTRSPEDGRIKFTEEKANETIGLIVKAPTGGQVIQVDFRGEIDSPRHARILRQNNTPQPKHALQLFRETPAGLRSQVRLMGPEATREGLVPGEPSKLDGVLTNVPNSVEYEVSLERNAEGVPTNAIIEGAVGSDSNMDVDLVDHQLGFELHQRGFTESFEYHVKARDINSAGRPRAASIAGVQSAHNPNGRLDLTYRGLRILMHSLMATFELQIGVEGPLDDPTNAVISHTQSSPNPDQLIQLIRQGPNGPRLALTARNTASSVVSEDGRHMDLLWTNVPRTFGLTVGRENGGKRAWLRGSQSDDKPNSILRMSQTRGDKRQEVRVEGLAPEWFLRALVFDGSLTDPRDIQVEVRSNIRHSTDLIQLRNYETGSLRHRMTLRGHQTPSPDGRAHEVEAHYVGIPEAFVMRDKRVRSDRREVSHSFSIINQKVVSPSLAVERQANPDGHIAAHFLANGPNSDVVRLDDIPASASFTYVRPRHGDANCLGNLAYEASAPTLDMKLDTFLDQGCANGELYARVEDLPGAGIETMYMDADGDGRIAFADGRKARKVTLSMAAPEDLVTFVENPPNVEAEEFCKEFLASLGCIDVTIRANPDFDDVRLNVQASDLTRATVATNVGEGGRASAYPGSSTRHEDHRLWELVPLIAVKNEGTGAITVDVTGDDNADVQSELYQKVACCTRGPKPLSRESTIDLDRPLNVRFYSWIVRQHSCQGLSQSGSYPVKCNAADEELRDDFGQAVACGGETVPLDPKFIASDPTRSGAKSRAGTTMYFVPNLFDSFMSDTPGDGRWYAWVAGGCKSDWFFSSLLREYEPDLLAGILNS